MLIAEVEPGAFSCSGVKYVPLPAGDSNEAFRFKRLNCLGQDSSGIASLLYELRI